MTVMFKKALIGSVWFAAGLCTAIGINATAQIYVGASVGTAYQTGIGDNPGDRSAYSLYLADREETVGAIFAGYRWKYIGGEVGTGKLFKSYFQADCEGSSGSQEINASYRYARLNAYLPVIYGFEVVPFYGVAFVKYENFEQFTAPAHNPPHVENFTSGRSTSPLYGIGVEKRFGAWMLRAEYQRVDRVAEDRWTTNGWHNDVQTVSLGIGRYF